MGNSPSSTSSRQHSASPAPHGQSQSHESKAPSTRRDPRNHLINSQRTAVAAEASLAQARGTTATHRSRNSQSIPTASFSHSSPSHSLNNPSQHSSDSQMGSQQSKQDKDKDKAEPRDQPSKPVDVPIPLSTNNETSTSRSHSHSIEPSGPPATQDMSYHLTRPPRLPLPIEEEVHTPGSPIIAPADVDTDAPPLDIDPLEAETLPRRSSALSNTTIDDEDAEELRVDKSGATVPTTFEWKRGGDKVYVTGTIFQWNKKHRLHPV